MDENKPDAEYQARIDANSWDENMDEVLNLIKKLLPPSRWSWVLNARCKYVSIRIDMRDGAFVLLDRDGQRISPAQLKYQCAAPPAREEEKV